MGVVPPPRVSAARQLSLIACQPHAFLIATVTAPPDNVNCLLPQSVTSEVSRPLFSCSLRRQLIKCHGKSHITFP
jgi:hypothetical protein